MLRGGAEWKWSWECASGVLARLAASVWGVLLSSRKRRAPLIYPAPLPPSRCPPPGVLGPVTPPAHRDLAACKLLWVRHSPPASWHQAIDAEAPWASPSHQAWEVIDIHVGSVDRTFAPPLTRPAEMLPRTL